ncbi:hypothetical protein JWG44_00130 [Leptospira sp. 201903071]|nr:hypothetical protein [Leptospira ainazelensis]MBM9498660.1 hypothetical protein [Leptospira ainazelensis]
MDSEIDYILNHSDCEFVFIEKENYLFLGTGLKKIEKPTVEVGFHKDS